METSWSETRAPPLVTMFWAAGGRTGPCTLRLYEWSFVPGRCVCVMCSYAESWVYKMIPNIDWFQLLNYGLFGVFFNIAVTLCPLKALLIILCVCLHLCDRATLGSYSSLKRIGLKTFQLLSDTMWVGNGPFPSLQVLWSVVQSHGPSLCVSSSSDRLRPKAAAEVQGETLTKDAASVRHILTHYKSTVHCLGRRKSVELYYIVHIHV